MRETSNRGYKKGVSDQSTLSQITQSALKSNLNITVNTYMYVAYIRLC